MKKLAISILLPALLLAYQPPNPPPVTLASLQPQPVFWPAVIVGAAVVGGAGWVGIKIVNKILEIHEHRITNGAPDQIVFTFDGEESGQ